MDPIAYAHRAPELFSSATLTPVNPGTNHGAIPVTELSPILIASPHPDDETLGCGGLIARCASLDCTVTTMAMTNGEASHPGDTTWQGKLGEIRRHEQQNALKALGLNDPDVIPLALPDGGLDRLDEEHYERLHKIIVDVLQSRSIRTLFVPAIDDCHVDHQMTARLLAKAALSHPVRHFFSYQIWPPEARPARVSANECEYAHDISDLAGLKRAAVYQHRSQLNAIDADHTEGFRMPDALLAAKLKNTESFALVRDIAAWSDYPLQH